MTIRQPPLPRWAVSFADLALLLLAFFVLLHAGSAREVAAAARSAFSGEPPPRALLDMEARLLFEPGEARLTPRARARLTAIGRAAGGRLLVESSGTDKGAARFDGWELSAARAAAIARTLEPGRSAADRVTILLVAERTPDHGQRIRVSRGR